MSFPEQMFPESPYPKPKYSESSYPEPKYSESTFPEPKYPGQPRVVNVLSVAGTDPLGAAGILGDVKAISANGGYALGICSALVAQNSRRVTDIHYPPAAFLAEQLKRVFEDARIDAWKIGMLGVAENIEVVRRYACSHPEVITVLDPVMISSSGRRLLDENAVPALMELFHDIDVITPNLPELEALIETAGLATAGLDGRGLIEATVALARKFNVVVIAKGGHNYATVGEDVGNTAIYPDGQQFHVASKKVETSNTHGTGCALSSALATRLAQLRFDEQLQLDEQHQAKLAQRQCQIADWSELPPPAAMKYALEQATNWLHHAIETADRLDVLADPVAGNGPVNHFGF